jgi:hypothetical protein
MQLRGAGDADYAAASRFPRVRPFPAFDLNNPERSTQIRGRQLGPLHLMARRFPPPWTAEESAGGYVVRDANGQSLAYVYSRDNANDAATAKVLTKDEARRIARNIAKLPQLLRPK